MRSRGDFRSGAEHAELCSTLDVFGGKRRTVEGLRAQAKPPLFDDHQYPKSVVRFLWLREEIP